MANAESVFVDEHQNPKESKYDTSAKVVRLCCGVDVVPIGLLL